MYIGIYYYSMLEKYCILFFSENLHSSLNVRDHVSQSYSTTGNIIVSCILIFKLLEGSREDKSV